MHSPWRSDADSGALSPGSDTPELLDETDEPDAEWSQGLLAEGLAVYVKARAAQEDDAGSDDDLAQNGG